LIPESTAISGFHPTYENLQDKKYTKKDAQEFLNITGRVLLFFGFVRPYKGLIYLLTAMPEILSELGPDVQLLIVGECWEDEQLYTDIIQELKIGSHILRVNEYIPNEEINLYFSATDLVVIPYSSATGSGILQMAFGSEKPVVATRVGGLADDVIDGKTGYLVSPKDPKGLAVAIIDFFKKEKQEPFSDNIRKEKDRFSWERMVNLIIDSVRNT
jgi:glycosyltransferase involved in cell wall biosynthesis